MFKVEDCVDNGNIYKISCLEANADPIYYTYDKITYVSMLRPQYLSSKDIITLLAKVGKEYNYLSIDTDYGFEIMPYSRWLELLICELNILEKSCSIIDHTIDYIYNIERIVGRTNSVRILQIGMSDQYSDRLWHNLIIMDHTDELVEYNGLNPNWTGIILMRNAVLQLLQQIGKNIGKNWRTSLPSDFKFVIKRDKPWLNILINTIKVYELPNVPIEEIKPPITTITPKPYYTRANGKTKIDMPSDAAAIEIIPSGSIAVIRNNEYSFILSPDNLEIIKNIQDVNNPHATIRFGYEDYAKVQLCSDEPFYYRVIDKNNLPANLKCYRQISCGNFTTETSVEYYYTDRSVVYAGDLIKELQDKHNIYIYKKTLSKEYVDIFNPNNHGVIEY